MWVGGRTLDRVKINSLDLVAVTQAPPLLRTQNPAAIVEMAAVVVVVVVAIALLLEQGDLVDWQR